MNIITKRNHSPDICATNYFTDYSTAKMFDNIAWTDLSTSSRQLSLSNIPQMHPIRFPTPPTTPPKGPQELTRIEGNHEAAYAQRTQSVIMKVGQCQQTPVDNVRYQNPTGSNNLDKFEKFDGLSPISFRNIVCNWTNCKRLFENLAELAAHVNKIHAISSTVDGLYYCQWDGCSRSDRGFNARYKMLVHVRTHTKEKPHQCHLCGKSFSRAENLKIHARSHSGEKPYVCTYEGCLKAYSNSSDRFKHSRTHSIEKPYLCKVPGCLKRYTDPSSLRKHVKTFRHAEQLINSAKHKTNTLKASEVPDGSKNCIYPNITSNATNCCNDHYILDVNSARIFCMDIDDMNYYYDNKKSEAKKLWLRSDDGIQPIKSRYILRDVDMDVNVEVPLDLRINRIV